MVDDGSPDGTGKLADELAADDDHLTVLHRTEKGGLGAAYKRASRSLDAGFDVIGEMDADGSHQPEQLHLLLDALAEADLVIGSRWVPGGSVVNWPMRREWLSAGGNPTSACSSASVSGMPQPATGCFGAARSRRSTSRV